MHELKPHLKLKANRPISHEFYFGSEFSHQKKSPPKEAGEKRIRPSKNRLEQPQHVDDLKNQNQKIRHHKVHDQIIILVNLVVNQQENISQTHKHFYTTANQKSETSFVGIPPLGQPHQTKEAKRKKVKQGITKIQGTGNGVPIEKHLNNKQVHQKETNHEYGKPHKVFEKTFHSKFFSSLMSK
jgi:hypothetical protein